MNTEPTIGDLLAATGDEFWRLVAMLRIVGPNRLIWTGSEPNRPAIQRAKVESPREAAVLARTVRASGLTQVACELLSKETMAMVLEDVAVRSLFVPTEFRLRALIAIIVQGYVEIWAAPPNAPSQVDTAQDTPYTSDTGDMQQDTKEQILARYEQALEVGDVTAQQVAGWLSENFPQLCRAIREELSPRVVALESESWVTAKQVTDLSPAQFREWLCQQDEAGTSKAALKESVVHWLARYHDKELTNDVARDFADTILEAMNRLRIRFKCPECGEPARLTFWSTKNLFQFVHSDNNKHARSAKVPKLKVVGMPKDLRRHRF